LETEPGEQAQVDFGSVRYRTPEDGYRRLWVFVMMLSWSTFIRCHLHAFGRLGVPKRVTEGNVRPEMS
jgi:transposase